MDLVIGDLWGGRASQVLFHPRFLKESRLDAICALLIPISIVLWWPRPSSASKRIVACCLGIATASVPVAVQTIVWPFIYHSPDGVFAVAVVAVLATALLSIVITRRLLNADSPDALAGPIVPHHIRRGLLRLYIVLFVSWVSWFGNVSYTAHHLIDSDLSFARDAGKLRDLLDDDTQSVAPA